MASKKPITVLQLERIIKQGKPGRYAAGNNLYLNISPTKTASWLFRYQIDKRPRTKGLGVYNSANTLAKMRKKAAHYQAMLSDGIDPIEAEREQKAEVIGKNAAAQREAMLNAMTFRRCAEDFIEVKRAGWKNAKHAQQWQNTLSTYAYPVIGDLPVKDITNSHLLKILTPIWTKKTETATRVRNRIELVLGYSAALRYRPSENPAQWRGNLEALLPKPDDVRKVKGGIKHHAALPYDDMPDFMAQLTKEQGLGVMALRLTILTAVRTSEAIKAEWPEIDFDKKLWTIPASRMKKDVEHKVPLADSAITLLQEIKVYQCNQFLFPGLKKDQPLSTGTMAAVLKRMNRTDITVHGFRSTFRDWAAEKTHFPERVAEMALAHKLKDATEAAYQRGDLLEKRQGLMEAWADYCLPKISNVSRLRA